MPWKKLLATLTLAVSLLYAQGTPADDKLYDTVRMKLASDAIVGRAAIEVEVKSGVVTMRGKVHTEKEKHRAGKIAAKVKGVSSVNNQLVVAP